VIRAFFHHKAEHDASEWQAAMRALMLVAEHDGADDVHVILSKK
jgi:hypothetical protein